MSVGVFAGVHALDGILANQDAHRAFHSAAIVLINSGRFIIACAKHAAFDGAAAQVDEGGKGLVICRVTVDGVMATAVDVAFDGAAPHVDPTLCLVGTRVRNVAAAAIHVALDGTGGDVHHLVFIHHTGAAATKHVIPNHRRVVVTVCILLVRLHDVDGGVTSHLARRRTASAKDI